MKIKLAFATLIIMAVFSCNQQKKNPQDVETDLKKEKPDSFFPVTSFLKGQLRMIDSLPITPLYKIIIKGKTDSSWVKKEEIQKILQPFVSTEITETNLVTLFKETKFNDLSLNAITFTYDAKAALPDSLFLKHWDVYVNPETGIVSKIYLVKNIKENQKNITQQLTWQTDRSAKIVLIENKPDGSSEILREENFIWKF